jgi:hypothetical protein
MATRHTLKSLEQEQNILHDNCAVELNEAARDLSSEEDEEVIMNFQKNVTNELLLLMRDGKDLYMSWKSDKEKMKKNNESYCLGRDPVKVILKKVDQLNINDYSLEYLIEGYTRAITKTEDGSKIILHVHPCFQGKKWYIWAYVHFEELNALCI